MLVPSPHYKPIKDDIMAKKYSMVLWVAAVFCVFCTLNGCVNLKGSFDELPQENGDIWLYPKSEYYQNDAVGVSVTFPESWLDEIVLIEQDKSFQVFFRPAIEKKPELGPNGTGLFVFQAVDKTDSHIVEDLALNPMVSMFAENENRIYYVTKLYQSIEIYSPDIWAEYSELLEEMGNAIENNQNDMIQLLDQ